MTGRKKASTFFVNKNRDAEKPSSNILHIAHLDDSVTKHIIWRTVRWRGLAQPRDIRMVECGGGQSSAFLEFRTNAEAEAVMDEFNCRLFSEDDNISFLNLSTKKARPEIKTKINYVFLHWRSLRKNEVTLSTSNDHQHQLFKTLPDLKKYIKELKAKSTLVAVLESVDTLDKLNQICDNQTNQMFCGWLDLNQLVLSRYDASYLKYSSPDETRLPPLLYQTYPDLDPDQPDGPKSEMMKIIFEAHNNPESQIQLTSLNPDHHHLVMLLDVGLVRFNSSVEGRELEGYVMASLAVRTAQGSFNCGIDLSSYTEDSVDWDSAKMLGLHLSTSGAWLKDSQPCLSEKSCLDQLLHFMSKGLESAMGDCEDRSSVRVGGVILTTILHEDSLLYLCAAMKRHGLFKQFENVVAGFCHLETVFRKRNICRKVFSLRYLDRYLQSAGVACTGGYGNLESERSEVLAGVGYEALNHIMDGNIMTEEFLQEYCYPVRSGNLNSLLGDSIHKSDLSIFDPEVCESRLHHSVTLLPGQTTSLTVMVTPALASYTNTVLQFIPECLPQQNLYKVITDTQRTNPSGMMLVKVLNQTRNKIRLPKGLYFGLLRLSNQPDQQIEPEISIVKTISNYPRVDLERIKIEPSSDSSDESVAGDPAAFKCTDEDTNDDEDAKKPESSSSSTFTSQTPDLEFIIASKASDFFATSDILQELSDQLNPEPPSGWEDLNPTFSSLGISSALSDVDMDLVPMFDDIASGINVSDDNNKAAIQLDLGIPLDYDKSGETVSNLCDVNEMNNPTDNDAKDKTAAAENSLKRMPKQGVTLSKDKPLIPQLKIIRKIIENNKVDGDLSIQFPSLIGEEDYIPLYKTLMQYTGLTLDDLSYDYVEFGEKVYSEILNFDLTNGLVELGDIMKELYNDIKDANVETWANKFSERFSSLLDINELNGENFDLMLVQFILLHFCQDWQVSDNSADTNIRDMYGFPETEGYDMVQASDQQLSQIASISSDVAAPSSTLSADTNCFDFPSSPFIEDPGLPEQILEAVALATAEPILQRLCFPEPVDNMEIQQDNNCDSNEIKDGDERNKDSGECIDTAKDFNEDQESLIENVSNDFICRELNPLSSIVVPDAAIATTGSTDDDVVLLPNTSEERTNTMNESITATDANQKELLEASRQEKETNSSEILDTENSKLILVQNKRSSIPEISSKVSEVNKSELNAIPNSKEESIISNVNKPSGESPSKDNAKEKSKSKDFKQKEQSSSKRSNKSDTPDKSKKDKSATDKNMSPGSSNIKLKAAVKDTSKTVVKQEEPPFDGDKNFDDLYLAIKMQATKDQSSILVFVGDLPRNSVITGEMLLVHGKQQNNQVNVKDILEKAEDGDGDTMLVLISSLDQDQAQVKLAVPLALWQDNRYFFRGFILFRESKDRYRGAFINKNKLETVSIDISRIKNFDGDFDTPLEPGVEVNLMVKPREAIGAMQPKYRATLCIPDPEKRCYDLLETTYWTAKTRTHFTEPDTVHDIAENCGNGIYLHVLKERERNFFIIRGKDKKSCIDSFNKIIQARNLFEQLPGNRPKNNTTLEIMIDSVPFTKTCRRPVNLMSLQLTAHYTGTSLRIMDDELAIEGTRQDLVELARHALTFALSKSYKEQVQIGSVMSTSGPDLHAKTPSKVTLPVSSTSTRTSSQKTVVRPPPVNVKPLSPVLQQMQVQVVDEDEVTSTTSEDVVNKKVEVVVVEDKTESPNPSPSTIEPSQGPAAPLITTVDDEEETLRQIFYAEGPKLEMNTLSPPRKQSQVHRIPLKLGKSFTMAPGDSRSITLALKQKLTKKYLTRTHAHFDKFLDKIKVVLELVNGSNVIVDLENISKSAVDLSSEQYIVTLVERIPKVNKAQATSNPTGPGFVRKQQVSKGGIKTPSMQQGKPVQQPSPTMTIAGGDKSQVPVKKYKVCLQENISIPGKSVSYAHVAVVNGDSYVFDKVHEIRRHPDFKNNAIFVPERQKKKICEAVKLHMSIRNRVDAPTSVAKGTLVGQIVVPMPLAEKDKKSNKRSSPNNSTTPKAKRIKQHPQAERSSSRNSNSSGGSTGRRTPEPDNITTSSVDKQKLLAIIKNAVVMTKKSTSSKQDTTSSAKILDDKNMSGSRGITLEPSSSILEDELPCSHDQLREQACKNIMLGLECKDVKCLEINQHKLPLDFVMLRNKEFCLDYLRKRVCAKSFHPFVCKAEYHVYDVMEIVKFYADYVEELKDNCGWCRKMLQAENAKKSNEKTVAKDCEVISLDNAEVPKNAETQNKTKPKSMDSKSVTSEPSNNKIEKTSDPLKCTKSISEVDNNVNKDPVIVTSSEDKPQCSQATLTKQLELESSKTENKTSSLSADKDSEEPEIQAIAVKIVRPIDTDIETVCLDQESSIEDDKDDIQIIDIPDIATSPLKLSCAHITMNSSLCPRLGKCKNKTCPHAHTIAPSLKLTYCSSYLESGQCSQLATCTALHVDYDDLQELYLQALRKAVLTCNKCFFNCKLFNPKKKKHRQSRICFKDFTAYCRNKQECLFIHFEELGHLDMLPPCKIFASREMCPKRSIEKGVVHMTHRNYQNILFKKINQQARKCVTCSGDLETLQVQLDQRITNNSIIDDDVVPINDKADVGAASIFEDMPDLETVSEDESDELLVASTSKKSSSVEPSEAVHNTKDDAKDNSEVSSTSKPNDAEALINLNPLNNQNKPFSSQMRVREDQSRSPTPTVVPSHSRLPPTLAPCSRIQIVKPKISNPSSKASGVDLNAASILNKPSVNVKVQENTKLRMSEDKTPTVQLVSNKSDSTISKDRKSITIGQKEPEKCIERESKTCSGGSVVKTTLANESPTTVIRTPLTTLPTPLTKPATLLTPSTKQTTLTTPSTNASAIATKSTTLTTPSTKTTTLTTHSTKTTTLTTPSTKLTTLTTPSTKPTTLTTPSTKPTTLTTPSTKSTTLTTPSTKPTTLTTPSTKPTTLTTPSTKPTTLTTPSTKPTILTTPSTKPTTSTTPSTKPTTLTTRSTKPTTLTTPSTKPTTPSTLTTSTTKPTTPSSKPTALTTTPTKTTTLTTPSTTSNTNILLNTITKSETSTSSIPSYSTATSQSASTATSKSSSTATSQSTSTATSQSASTVTSQSTSTATSQSTSASSKQTNSSVAGRSANVPSRMSASSAFKRAGGHVDSHNQPPFKTARRVCQFFGSVAKCKNGNKCPNIHDLSLLTCRFWKAGYCQYGSMCKRKHAY